MLIDEECGNLKAVVHGGELTRNATQNKKPHVYKPVDMHSVTNATSIGNIVNQLGKCDFSCGLVVNNFKQTQLFFLIK